MTCYRCLPRRTARAIMFRVWSHFVPRILIVPLTVCVAKSTSIVNRSVMMVNRLCFSAHGTYTVLAPVRRALHARNPGDQNRLELAGIKVPPPTLLSVIMTTEFAITVGTAEPDSSRVINLHANLGCFVVEFNIAHRPR